jgi:hypothetical protein
LPVPFAEGQKRTPARAKREAANFIAFAVVRILQQGMTRKPLIIKEIALYIGDPIPSSETPNPKSK